MTPRRLVATAIVLTGLIFTVGYGLADNGPLIVALPAGWSLLWLVAEWRGWQKFTAAGLVVFIGLAAAGVRLGVGSTWLLLGTVGGLAAWDLARFARRLSLTAEAEPAALLPAHLRRLLVVAGAALLFGALALASWVELNFGLAVLLGLLMSVSLSWLVGFFRRARE